MGAGAGGWVQGGGESVTAGLAGVSCTGGDAGLPGTIGAWALTESHACRSEHTRKSVQKMAWKMKFRSFLIEGGRSNAWVQGIHAHISS